MRLRKSFAIFSAAAFGLFLTACSRTNPSQSASSANPPGTYADRPAATSPSIADRDFAAKAARGGMAELEIGNLARRKGATEQVKNFGEKLVRDHTRLNTQLNAIAARENLSLPSKVDDAQSSVIKRLAKLSGARFDRELKKVAMDDHMDDIAEFQKEASNGTDQALKDFAAEAGPTLQEHLNNAEALKR